MNREPLAALGQGEEYVLQPAAERLYDVVADGKIVSWREECFTKLGFTLFQARTMAIRRDIDREVVERAIKGGAQHRHVMEALL